MSHDPQHILSVLDKCCETYSFPMLDNRYVYLAATRLSLFHSITDWALAIEIFGFSPRNGSPDVHISTFASQLHNRNTQDGYVNQDAYENYLSNNPNNESRFFFPIDDDLWQDPEECELVLEGAEGVRLRGNPVSLPLSSEYLRHGVELEEAPQIQVYELCRCLAATHRESVLATPSERRINVLPDMQQILQLEEWYHPDILNNERPSRSMAFKQLAQVLAVGDPTLYQPSVDSNTHWRNWPLGGSL